MYKKRPPSPETKKRLRIKNLNKIKILTRIKIKSKLFEKNEKIIT